MGTHYKQNFLLLIFFGVLALSLLSPLASNEFIPQGPNFINHIVNISQAKLALDAGQFPARIAPELYHGWGYAYYQFYAPMAYTIAAEIYKWITPNNPYIAFKITLWLMLTLAGLYTYRLTNLFVKSKAAALLSGMLFVMAPYLLCNINARGDFTESVSTCILPFAIYYSIQFQRRPSASAFIFTALAWFAIATTHITTFIFTSLFIGAFMVILNVQERLPFKNLFFLVGAYALGWILALWYLAPVVLFESYLYAHLSLTNPYHYNWLSPLMTLLSPTAVSPIPLPGNSKLYCPFYVAIGWPMVLAAGIAIYKKMIQRNTPYFVMPLLFLFFIALFLAWTPFNFWVYLPHSFEVVQYGCRFLIQIMWIGSILFAWAIAELFEYKLDMRHVVLGILLIGIANSPWLATTGSSDKKIPEILKHPALYDIGARSQLVSPLLYPHAAYPDNLMLVKDTEKSCEKYKLTTHCQIHATSEKYVQLPILFYPNMMRIKVNGKTVDYQPTAEDKNKTGDLNINPMLVTVKLDHGDNVVSARYVGLRWANTLSLMAWVFLGLTCVQAVLHELKNMQARLELEAMAKSFNAMKKHKNYLDEANEIENNLNDDLPEDNEQWWKK